MAVTTEKYALYQAAVQNPELDVALFERVFKELHGTTPRTLREDFCGTAAVCCAWVKRGSRREAWGVDLDRAPLAWGRKHNVASLGASQQSRVHLVQADARDARTPRVDVVAVQNFSFGVLKTREALRAYFRAAKRALDSRGMLFLDVMGGSSMQDDDVGHSRRMEGFTYRFNQRSFDPITHETIVDLHFDVGNRRSKKPAFTYRWRMWFIPEIRETLLEAGFSDVAIYWPHSDPRTGAYVHRRREKASARPTWLAYVAAVP